MEKEVIGDISRIIDLKNRDNYNFFVLVNIIRYLITSAQFRAIFCYRIANQKFFRNRKSRVIFSKIGSILSGIFIPPTAKIDSGLLLGHPKCIVLHYDCSIGKNVTILQSVTIGGNLDKKKYNQVSPIIGDNVLIGAGAKILGPITIGKNSMIGANAVVIKDIPENSVAVGIPAKVVKKIEKSYIDLKEENDKIRGKFDYRIS